MFVPSRISSSIKQNFLKVNKKLFQLIVFTLITTHHSIIILLYKLILRAFRIHFTQVHANVTLIYVLELYNKRFRKEFENFCVPGDFKIKSTKRLRQQSFDRINTIFQFKTNNTFVASNGFWPQRRCDEQEVCTYRLIGITGVKGRLGLNDFPSFFFKFLAERQIHAYLHDHFQKSRILEKLRNNCFSPQFFLLSPHLLSATYYFTDSKSVLIDTFCFSSS